jgi:ABC-type glycerol-3-phosphate transport system permease component
VIWTILASVNLICTLLAYSFLAYALARLRWHGRGIALVLLAIVLCAQVWLVPQLISAFVFQINAALYWIWFADWLVSAFAVVLLWQSLKDTSRDRADAAKLDGCGRIGIYWHVVLPLVRLPLLLLALFSIMGLSADVLSRISEMLRIGVLHVVVPNLSFLIASSAIMTIPLIALFFIASKLLAAPKSVRPI